MSNVEIKIITGVGIVNTDCSIRVFGNSCAYSCEHHDLKKVN